jgi:ferredoxin
VSTEIYYFTGTGNSLAVARDIAQRAEGVLISIPSVVDEERVATDAEAIGIAFPVYYASLGGSGIPHIVERFVRRLGDISSKYLFAVCTHSGMPADTIENLGRIIKSVGGELSVGCAVQMSIPYTAGDKIRHMLFHRDLAVDSFAENERQQELLTKWSKKLNVLLQQVHPREHGKLEVRSALSKALLTPLAMLQEQAALSRYRSLSQASGGTLDELVPFADSSFFTNEACNGCAICARICPVGNIEMVDDKPVWQHRCETCYACFQWCPQEAIYGSIVEYEKRYHHPDVKLSDMLRQVSKG